MADIEIAYEPMSLLNVHTQAVEGTEAAHWAFPGPEGPKAGAWGCWGGQCSRMQVDFPWWRGWGPGSSPECGGSR